MGVIGFILIVVVMAAIGDAMFNEGKGWNNVKKMFGK